MKDIRYEFMELESDQSFQMLAEAFQGKMQNDTLHFDNPFAQGQLIRKSPEDGLLIRKWRLTSLQKITLRRLPAAEGSERKFSLIYFLNPSVFQLKEGIRKVRLNTQRNNLFLPNQVMMDFSVVPKQPFYVLDISFTQSWLFKQFNGAVHNCKEESDLFLKNLQTILIEPCNAEEYKLLHEMDTCMQADKEDNLLIRSRVYLLISSFFSKAFLKNKVPGQKQKICNYEQVVKAEAMLMKQLQKLPSVGDIASGVNMSTASLLRQFKSMFGKSLHEYYIEKKMELARRMLGENQITIKKLAENLGYKQSSHFIETFTKYFGYSPGSLKVY